MAHLISTYCKQHGIYSDFIEDIHTEIIQYDGDMKLVAINHAPLPGVKDVLLLQYQVTEMRVAGLEEFVESLFNCKAILAHGLLTVMIIK